MIEESAEDAGPAPYFSTGKPSVRPTRRVLLISYYYPPINVVGALRWQKLSCYAAARGWALDVILADPSTTATIDSDRLLDLPPGARLYAVPDKPSRSYELQRWLWRTVRPLFRRQTAPISEADENRGRPAVPAVEPIGAAYLSLLHYGELFRWARRAAAVGMRIVGTRRPDWIVSSAPPHSTHEAARLISERTGIPWVMDMRDAWCTVEMMPRELASRTWLRLAKRHEARCVRSARLVSVTTEALRRDLCERYPDLQSRFLTVMNGADPHALPTSPPSRCVTVAYAGNLYVGRDPRNLFRAVASVVRDLSLTPADLQVEFMGGADFGRKPISEIAEESGAAGFVKLRPLQPRHAALSFLGGASMLVSLPQYAHLAIPAKVFEYVQYNAWLLVLAEQGSATELLFRDSDADVVDPADVEAIAAAIRRRFEQHRRGERPVALNRDGRFDRAGQAKILLDAMERLD